MKNKLTPCVWPWNRIEKSNQEPIKQFIKAYKEYLRPNQIEIIEHFMNNVNGFYIHRHDMLPACENPNRMNREVLFVFEHLGVKGEIKVCF